MTSLLDLSKLPLEWLRVACELGPGKPRKPVSDPWVLAVSEQRSTTPRYSCCADLAHWWLTRLGFRRGWLNRSELPGGWQRQVNVGRICATPWGARHEATNITTDLAPPAPGDALTVRADNPDLTHVLIPITEWGTTVTFAEYGQPGGAVHEKIITVDGNRWVIGERTLHSCLRLAVLGPPDVDEDFAAWAAAHHLEVPVAMLGNDASKLGEAP